jgi:hypothetical protein
MAASVSAVSPDCVMPMTRSPSTMTGVAVAELAGHVDHDGHAGPRLQRVGPDQARVVGGAAADDDDPPGVAQDLDGQRARVVEVHAVVADGAVGDRLGQGVRLLVDLLEHERLVARLLGGLLVPVDALDLAVQRRGVRGEELGAVRGDRTISPFSMYCTSRVCARKAGRRRRRRSPPRRGRR